MQTMLRSKITLLSMMMGLLLAIPAVAIAADINKTFNVDATQEGWQDTGIFLRAGDHVVIDGSGTVDLDCNHSPIFDNTPPDGVAGTPAGDNSLLPSANLGALIGKIDSGDPFVVGDSKTIDSVGSSGELFLAVNDTFGGFGDNCGHFTADIAVNHPDTRHPRVISTAPGAGASGVAPLANIKADFSEEMRNSSIKRDTFKLFKKGSTTKVGATVAYNAKKDRAILDPINSLKRGVTYKAIVTTGAKDEAGNRLDQDRSVSGLQKKVWFFEVSN